MLAAPSVSESNSVRLASCRPQGVLSGLLPPGAARSAFWWLGSVALPLGGRGLPHAKQVRYGGDQARTASYGQLFQTVLSSVSSPSGGPDLATFAMKYGGLGPQSKYG